MEHEDLIKAWQAYCQNLDWQQLIQGIKPKPTGCGPIYEMPSPLDRPGEDFAICDMRPMHITEPHYHPDGNWEFYFCLDGSADVYLGEQQTPLTKGGYVAI